MAVLTYLLLNPARVGKRRPTWPKFLGITPGGRKIAVHSYFSQAADGRTYGIFEVACSRPLQSRPLARTVGDLKFRLFRWRRMEHWTQTATFSCFAKLMIYMYTGLANLYITSLVIRLPRKKIFPLQTRLLSYVFLARSHPTMHVADLPPCCRHPSFLPWSQPPARYLSLSLAVFWHTRV